MSVNRRYFPESDACWLRALNAAPLQPRRVALLGDAAGAIIDTIEHELRLVGVDDVRRAFDAGADVLVGTLDDLGALPGGQGDAGGWDALVAEARAAASDVGDEGYAICVRGGRTVLAAPKPGGLLYGYFRLLRAGEQLLGSVQASVRDAPVRAIRMLNQWDNMSDTGHMGSVERGYAGDSIFFRDGAIVADKQRIVDYARLLASVGINALSINNVNVHREESRLLTDHLAEVAEIAGILRGFGIALFTSVNFAAPIEIGGLDTADPTDETVAAWWAELTASVYAAIPDFGGYVVKADSEGRPGPFTYGRDHTHGANTLARALRPFGGVVFWRCFVYNSQQDWRDRSTDRARAAYDHFAPLDGGFDDNVVLQVKNGPMDFQVREPVSPLIGALHDTNLAVEFQITQEYTGHQKDLFYLVPRWREVLQFDMSGEGEPGRTVDAITSGSRPGQSRLGICAVSNIGSDANWTGHKLAQANLYGFGRLAWNGELTAEEILDEWLRLTFGLADEHADIIRRMMLDSPDVYESYTAPLGVGWMVTPGLHYGPSVDGYEYSRWGTYHFADHVGIGVDRTVATGTGYAGQYAPAWAERYEHLGSCPDELLLFFHHVPYTHVLHSGATVIQHIYDTHFEGAERVQRMVDGWQKMRGCMDDASFTNVAERLQLQLANAREWRDQIRTYFWRKSGVPDERSRSIY